MSENQHGEYLSPADLAALIDVPIGTIYQWNYRGIGPRRLRVGKHVRYRRADVEAWLTAQQQGPSAA